MPQTAEWITENPASTAAQAVSEQLKVDVAKGLSGAEAQSRLESQGPNRLTATKSTINPRIESVRRSGFDETR